MMNNMDKWVDPRIQLVKPANVQAYLLARAWKPKSSPRPQLLIFQEPPRHEGKPILQTVPACEGGSAYLDAIVRVITNLAALENRYAGDILTEILQQTSDSVPINGPASK